LKNEFDELLEYLEKQSEVTKKVTIKETPLEKKVDLSFDISEFKDIQSDVISRSENGTCKGFDVNEFESLMRSKLVDEYNKSKNYDRPYISVSELLSCSRKIYYERKKYKVDPQQIFRYSYLALINHVGNSIHQFIQSIYNFNVVEKTVISQKYHVKGRVDGIKNNCVVEIKTFDQDKYTNTYLPEHFDQANIYAFLLNEDSEFSIDTVTLVYAIRNLKKIEAFDIPIDTIRAISFLDKAIILKKCLDDNEVPLKDDSNKETCKYCPYKSLCKEDNEKKDVIRSKNSFSM
jgi:CRISPR/Cas system-associated exonuclease Cas4 (RecB family)